MKEYNAAECIDKAVKMLKQLGVNYEKIAICANAETYNQLCRDKNSIMRYIGKERKKGEMRLVYRNMTVYCSPKMTSKFFVGHEEDMARMEYAHKTNGSLSIDRKLIEQQ